MAGTESKRRPSKENFEHDLIRLHYSDREQGVLVEDKDEDRYFVTVEKIIKGLALYDSILPAQKQVRGMLSELYRWVRDRKDKISNAFITFQDGRFLLLVVQKEKKCNFELMEELADLDFSMANDERFNLIEVSALSLPESPKEVIEGFLSPELRLVFEHNAHK